MPKLISTASTTINCTPRKVRLVADLVRNMPVDKALYTLMFTNKKSAKAVAKVIKSACSNLGITNTDFSKAKIGKITVDESTKLKRIMPHGKGSASPFWRRWSKVSVTIV